MALTNNIKTANLNAQSKVGDKELAYLSANIQSNGAVSISISINSVANYTSNKEVVDTDIEAFKTDAIKTAQEAKGETE